MDTPPQNAGARRSFLKALGFAFVLFLLPLYAQAASLSIGPTPKSVTVGQIFSINAYVSSPDQAMNAASGDISFPSDKLQVLSVSKADSVMNLWIREPSYTNSISGGDVHFEGVVLNPGYVGVDGNVITIHFQAIGTGNAPITYTSGAVLANDGNGTNILTGMTPGDVTVAAKPVAPPAAPVTTHLPPSGSVASSTATATSTSSTISSTTEESITIPAVSSTEPSVVVGYIPSPSPWENALRFIAGWGLVGLLGLVLVALLVFLALYIVHRMRKWRVSSNRELLKLEEALHADIKRIEKELALEKRAKSDPLRKKIEHIDSDIDKL